MGLIQVGSTKFEVKGLVNSSRVPGGEFKETNFGQWDPLRWSENTTKGGGVGCVTAAAGEAPPLQVCLIGCGMLRKNQKN